MNKTNEPQRMKQVDSIRQSGFEQMAERGPRQAATLIKEQGKQILRESAEDWLKRKNISI